MSRFEGRRRRSDDDGDGGGGGLPLFPLIVVVIFAGLLLGGALAHFFGNGHPKPAPSTNEMAQLATATPAPFVIPSAAPSRSFRTPKPVGSSTPAPTPSGSAAPSASPTAPAATPRPSPTVHARRPHRPAPVVALSAAPVTAQPSPKRKVAAVVVTATPQTPAPAAVATAVPSYAAVGSDQATAIVRSYLGAVARGDHATAASYLAHGMPSEAFMDSNSRIESIRSASLGNRQYKVTADVQTSSGEYYITFTVEPGPAGLQITDHYAIKTQ